MKRARRLGKKSIIWAHVTVEDGMAVFRFMPLIAPLLRHYYTYAYGLADLVFCPSAHTKSLLIGYGLPAEKLMVVTNGVDTDKFKSDKILRESARQKFGLSGLTIGTVGQVQPRKDPLTFLQLAKMFPDKTFLWVGSFMNKLIIKGLPKQLPPNAKFPGYVENILEGFNALDIFLFPSIEENEGMAILEAASVGLPILVRNLPAYQGWLTDGENCLKANTPDEFAEKLKRLIDDEALRTKLSTGALLVAQRASIAAWSGKLKTIYDGLV